MQEKVDIREFIAIAKDKIWTIVLITVVAVVSTVISFFILKPVYEAESTLIVNTDKLENSQILTSDQVSVTQHLAVIYGEIIKSRSVLESVINRLNLDLTYEEILNKIEVSSVNDTPIMRLTVQDTNPQRTIDIAEEIQTVFKNEARRLTEANSVVVIDKPILPTVPVKPNKIMYILIAAMFGFMIGTIVVFLIEYLDNKLKTPQDIEKHIGLPILGVIPKEDLVIGGKYE